VALNHPLRVALLFGVGAALVLVLVYGLMIALGLPNWVFVGAVVLLAIGVPIIAVTQRHERGRAAAAATGLHVATPVGLARHVTWKKAIVGGVVAFGTLGIVAAAYSATRVMGIGPAATLMSKGAFTENELVVLATFDNRTTDSTIGTTVTELLRVSMSQSSLVRLMDPARLGESLQRMRRDPTSPVDAATAREIAEREGIKAILTGDIAPLGGGGRADGTAGVHVDTGWPHRGGRRVVRQVPRTDWGIAP